MCSNLIDPSLPCVRGAYYSLNWMKQRLSVGLVIFHLEVANRLESRHIPMQAVGIEQHARAFLPHDAWRKRSATFMAKIRVQCIFHTHHYLHHSNDELVHSSALLTRG